VGASGLNPAIYSLKGMDELNEKELADELLRYAKMIAINQKTNVFKAYFYNKFSPDTDKATRL
jgi:hypothetical protein